jgi:hypothetical protein
LLHPPRAIGRVGLPRLERLDLLLDLVVPAHVGHEIAQVRERAHRLDGHRLTGRELVHPRHAHQPRLAVDLGRARSTFARLAIPPHGEVAGRFGLDLMHRIEHHHAFGDFGLEVGEVALALLAAPNPERRRSH